MSTSPNTQSGEDLEANLESAANDYAKAWEKNNNKKMEAALDDMLAVIHRRESSLLDEVEKRVIGEVEPKPDHNCNYAFYDGRNVLRQEQHQTLQAIRQERGLASQHSNTKDNEETDV